MSLVVREADLDTDGPAIVECLKRWLTPLCDETRFQWLYRGNPFGVARTWIATDPVEGTIVGVASAFPRRVYTGKEEDTGWVLGDFCIAKEYRTLGPALQLQGYLVREVQSGAIPFFYDFPSFSMMAVFRRLRIAQTGQLIRLAMPLRVDRKLKEVLKVPVLIKALSIVGNMFLRLKSGRRGMSDRYALSLHKGLCGEEFSRLTHRIGGEYGVCVQRTAPYLNWRYFANPVQRHEMLTARLGRTLVGFAVFTQAGEDATIVDLLGGPEPGSLKALIGGCVDLFRRRGVTTIHAPLLDTHPWLHLFEDRGFRRRDAVPFVAYASPAFHSRYSHGYGPRWCLMHGDRES